MFYWIYDLPLPVIAGGFAAVFVGFRLDPGRPDPPSTATVRAPSSRREQ
jgi:hypothetical protein